MSGGLEDLLKRARRVTEYLRQRQDLLGHSENIEEVIATIRDLSIAAATVAHLTDNARRLLEIGRKYERAIEFLCDIADMGRTPGCETAAHGLAQLGEEREK